MQTLLEFFSNPMGRKMLYLVGLSSICLLVFILAQVGALVRDSAIEQVLEAHLKEQTGLDVDLSPE